MLEKTTSLTRSHFSPEQRIAIAVAGTGSFTTAFTAGVINVANPAIARELGLSVGQAGWVLTSTLLTICVLLPFGGRLGDVVGHIRSFGIGLFVFSLAAVFASQAPTFPWLLTARVMAGAGAAVLMATGPALITTRVPPSLAGSALGVQASMTYAGLMLGPVAGAWLVAAYGWRNAMLAAALLALPMAAAARVLHTRDRPKERSLARSSALHGMRALVSSPGYAAALAAGSLQYAASYSLVFLLPFQLEHTLREPSRTVGLLLAISPLAMAMLSPVGGALADRLGSRELSTLGMLVLALGLECAGAGVRAHQPVELAIALFCVGSGAAFFVTPNNRALMAAAPMGQRGLAGALVGLTRQFGMVLGVAGGTLCVNLFGEDSQTAGTRIDEATFAATLSVSAVIALAGACLSWRSRA